MLMQSRTLSSIACIMLIATSFACSSQVSDNSVSTSKVQGRQAYSATVWTVILQPVPNGSVQTFTQRMVVSQDAKGKWQKTYYHVTRGAQYDVSAAIDHSEMGDASNAYTFLFPASSAGEHIIRDEDLGTRLQDGLTLQGRRRTFESVGRNPVAQHVLENWYSPFLGAIVHSESHNFNGVVIISDLKDLHLGGTGLPYTSNGMPVAAPQVFSEPQLYRGLFSIIAHMERARWANPPQQLGNVAAVEELMRKKIGLSEAEWQELVATSVKVDAYMEQLDKQARDLASTARGKDGHGSASKLNAGLSALQVDRDNRVSGDISKLQAGLGAGSTTKLLAYLHGPLADSARNTHLKIQGKVAR